MATPHACWIILAGNVPTSFRAHTREELLPTFRQLQRTQTEVALRWFERGKVWESPAAASAAAKLAKTEGRRPRKTTEPRGREWRPGGNHKDPKARFEMTRDQKRAKFKRNLLRQSTEDNSPFQSRAKRERTSDDPFKDK